MTAFIILAAGPGTRVGGELHKALLPLKGRAVISHQIHSAPFDSRIIVCTGSRAGQVKDYLDLAHPGLPVTFVHIDDWDEPGNGPGATLLTARREVNSDEDLIFTSCDTYWESDQWMWQSGTSWAGVAPIPKGTKPERWTRIGPEGVFEKSEQGKGPQEAYTGLAHIKYYDQAEFWEALTGAELGEDQHQVTAGLKVLFNKGKLLTRPLKWTDTGDAESYAQAVAAMDGYDWSKPRETTWVLPDEDRVVKWKENAGSVARLMQRHSDIWEALPEPAGVRENFLAYEYVHGLTGYAIAGMEPDIVPKILNWAANSWWRGKIVLDVIQEKACHRFYRDKTVNRMLLLRTQEMRDKAWEMFRKIDFERLAYGCKPVTFHGDFNLGNIIVGQDGKFVAIDWREDFGGELNWGDKRYDLGKMLAGLYVNWDRARRGDFSPWPDSQHHIDNFALWCGGKIPGDVKIIAALSLLNSAPLHAEPLDEILVAKAAEILREVC